MGLLDKAKEQATKLADKAQEAGKAGQDKLKDVQAKRRADSLLRGVGAAGWGGRMRIAWGGGGKGRLGPTTRRTSASS